MNKRLNAVLTVITATALVVMPIVLYFESIRNEAGEGRGKTQIKTQPTPLREIRENRKKLFVPKASIKKNKSFFPSYLRLLATLIAGKKQESIASIKNLLTHKLDNYKLKDRVDGWEIVKIDSGVVTLRKNVKTVTLHLADGSDKEAITMLSSMQRSVNKVILAEQINNLNETLKSISFMPYSDAGGVNIKNIKGKKLRLLAEKAGIKEGDLIISVNGHKTSSLKELLGMYKDIRRKSTTIVKLKRKGKDRKLIYYIN